MAGTTGKSADKPVGKNKNPLKLRIIITDNKPIAYDSNKNILSDNQEIVIGTMVEFNKAIKVLPSLGYDKFEVLNKGVLFSNDKVVNEDEYMPIIEKLNNPRSGMPLSADELAQKLNESLEANKKLLERLEKLESKGNEKQTKKTDSKKTDEIGFDD